MFSYHRRGHTQRAVKQAIDIAFTNIEQFHRAQLQPAIQIETMPGIMCEKHTRAIESVGLYVPGGTAILPSTAMMLAIPAMIAGCPTRVLASPPGADGKLAPEIVYIARKAGVTHLLKAGGSQAIAAMAYGTQSVPKVDKLLRPGKPICNRGENAGSTIRSAGKYRHASRPLGSADHC